MVSLEERRRNIWFLMSLVLLVLVKSFGAIWMINFTSIDLNPDEAQYWTWSNHLDVGYYSKAPAIAWQIWAGCKIFGNTEIGVRFFSVVISGLMSLVTYLLVRFSGLSSRIAFWMGIALACSPMGFMASFAATTDGGFIFFWIVACAYLCRCLQQGERPRYGTVGLLIASGALFKWPQIYYLWGVILFASWRYPFFRSFRMVGGMALSLLGLLPSVIWNINNEWATFRHVYGQLSGSSGEAAMYTGNTLEFFGMQMALMSPLLFVVMALALIHMVRHRKEVSPAVLFCGWTTLSLLFFAFIRSLTSKVQGNWFVFAYPTAFVVMGWYIFERTRQVKAWFFAGLLTSIALVLFLLAVPALQKYDVVRIPYAYNAFQQSVGWDGIEGVLDRAGYDAESNFLFADKYQTASILSFYGKGKKQAYFFNIGNARKNQFSFWPGMAEEQVDNDGIFVVIENGAHLSADIAPRIDHYVRQLSPYFSSVTFIDHAPLFRANGVVVKRALLFRGINYNGNVPESVDRY